MDTRNYSRPRRFRCTRKSRSKFTLGVCSGKFFRKFYVYRRSYPKSEVHLVFREPLSLRSEVCRWVRGCSGSRSCIRTSQRTQKFEVNEPTRPRVHSVKTSTQEPIVRVYLLFWFNLNLKCELGLRTKIIPSTPTTFNFLQSFNFVDHSPFYS